MYIIPPVTHIKAMSLIRRDRRLPVPGTVTVRVNNRVQANDVVAEANVGQRHILVDVAKGLGVAREQVADYIICEVGDRVDAGDVIAGPIGLIRKTVRAPVKGRIAHLADGKVLIAHHGRPIELKAGFPGVVVSTDGTQEVSIETEGALVQGVWGNGKQDYGVLAMVGQRGTDFMSTDLLDINLRSAVIVAGICDHAAPLHQATELQARGLIVGGLSSELIPAVQRLAYPVIVLEGFGDIPMNSETYELLRTNIGHEASVDARPKGAFENRRPELIIPNPADHDSDLPEKIIPLGPEVKVRVVRKPYLGKVGVVQDLQPYGTVFPSGIIARCAKVDIDKVGIAEIPIANLEIIQ